MSNSTTIQTASPEHKGMGLHALIGAVMMVVLSFIPFSPVLGGIVAGYLHTREGLKVGALAGLFAAIPVAIIVIVIISILSFSSVTAPEGGMMSPLVGFGLMSAVILVLVSLYTAGLALSAATLAST